MSEWKEYKLGDVVQFGNGKSRPKAEGDIPVFGGNGILGFSNEANYEGETIIIGRVGAYCGSVFYQNKPIWVSDNALAAKPKNKFNALFLYYYLKNLQLNNFAEGSSHPLVTQTLLNSIVIPITDDVMEQTAIASILSSLDDKIDLLHRQNKTLEQLAETLFRQWFLRADTGVEEEMSEIQTEKLGDVIKTTSGGTPSRSKMEYYSNGNIRWVKSKELSGSFIFETEEMITEEALKNSSAKLLPANSILIAMYGATVGEFAILAEEATCNQAICALIPNEDYPYTYLFLLTKTNKENLLNLAVGSAQQNISQLLIKELDVSGDKKLIQNFHNQVETYFQKIKSNTTQIRTLTQLRDTLLPRLMSGEVRVKI